jgi:hypothetical protein
VNFQSAAHIGLVGARPDPEPSAHGFPPDARVCRGAENLGMRHCGNVRLTPPESSSPSNLAPAQAGVGRLSLCRRLTPSRCLTSFRVVGLRSQLSNSTNTVATF